ncbi:TPA: hypothetical protein ACPJ0D_002140 [Vibrio diabolicus]
MTITYIGKSGLLNQHLCNLLADDLNISVSARNYSIDEALQNDTIVWGGRYLLDDILVRVEENKRSKLLYISTFIYNDFCDNYQIRKLSDSVKVEKTGGCSLNVPFIAEFHDKILEKLSTQERSEYFTYRTNLQDISNAIRLFDSQGILSLEKVRVNIKLKRRECFLWKIFSLLYVSTDKVSPSKFTLAYLNAVKALEKVLHKLMFCHGLSAVYIKKDS